MTRLVGDKLKMKQANYTDSEQCSWEKWKQENQEREEELEELLLKGACPNCCSKRLVYQAIWENVEFGFNCYSCQWKGRYRFQEFRALYNKEKYKKAYPYESYTCN